MPLLEELQQDLDDIVAEWPTITFNGTDIPGRIVTGLERTRVPGHNAVSSSLDVLVRAADVTTKAKGTPVVVDGREWLLVDVKKEGLLCLVLDLRSKAAPIPRSVL